LNEVVLFKVKKFGLERKANGYLMWKIGWVMTMPLWRTSMCISDLFILVNMTHILFVCCISYVCKYINVRYICMCMNYNWCIVVYMLYNVCSLYMYDVYKHAFELYIMHTCQQMNYIMSYTYVYIMHVY
jgi:hypothetical protein